ncbi:hypothetical protein GCM10010331_44980 [Streptomyces xanthochromogenes]|nr:hypothetical protein GCM10010331_44980 [Streptomyces xanthochromogenes]
MQTGKRMNASVVFDVCHGIWQVAVRTDQGHCQLSLSGGGTEYSKGGYPICHDPVLPHSFELRDAERVAASDVRKHVV